MQARYIKLLLVNILVFVLLMVMIFVHEELDLILETGIGFYSMELGFLLGKGDKKNERKD